MSVIPDREAQRRQVLARIERNREDLRLTLHQLDRPMQAVERWQDRARTMWPVLPGLLLVGGVIWVCLRALGARSPGGRRLGWLARLQQAMVAYRVATQVRSLMRASSKAPRRPMPPPAPTTRRAPFNAETSPRPMPQREPLP